MIQNLAKPTWVQMHHPDFFFQLSSPAYLCWPSTHPSRPNVLQPQQPSKQWLRAPDPWGKHPGRVCGSAYLHSGARDLEQSRIEPQIRTLSWMSHQQAIIDLTCGMSIWLSLFVYSMVVSWRADLRALFPDKVPLRLSDIVTKFSSRDKERMRSRTISWTRQPNVGK